MRLRHHWALGLWIGLLAAAMASGCLNVADDRANFDETIGKASIAEAEVMVEGGLASVRSLTPGELVLWAQAPVLTVQLDFAEPGSWEVRVRNVLSDAQAFQVGTDGVREALALESQPIPTDQTWRLEVVQAGRVTLQIEPPDSGDETPWRFVIYADVQDHLNTVQDIYDRMRQFPDVRFGLISGDLTDTGTRKQLERFQEEMKTLPFPCYATLGNHDITTSEHLFQELYGRVNFSFGYRGVQFSFIDSANATVSTKVYDQLDGWLVDGAGGLHMAMMHIPPIDPIGTRNGSFASRGEANKLLTTMARGGVDMTVYGHVHSYYAFSNAGINAFITGGGGAFAERFDGIGRHFLLVDANPVTQTFAPAMIRVFPEEG